MNVMGSRSKTFFLFSCAIGENSEGDYLTVLVQVLVQQVFRRELVMELEMVHRRDALAATRTEALELDTAREALPLEVEHAVRVVDLLPFATSSKNPLDQPVVVSSDQHELICRVELVELVCRADVRVLRANFLLLLEYHLRVHHRPHLLLFK